MRNRLALSGSRKEKMESISSTQAVPSSTSPYTAAAHNENFNSIRSEKPCRERLSIAIFSQTFTLQKLTRISRSETVFTQKGAVHAI